MGHGYQQQQPQQSAVNAQFPSSTQAFPPPSLSISHQQQTQYNARSLMQQYMPPLGQQRALLYVLLLCRFLSIRCRQHTGSDTTATSTTTAADSQHGVAATTYEQRTADNADEYERWSEAFTRDKRLKFLFSSGNPYARSAMGGNMQQQYARVQQYGQMQPQ